MENRDYRIKIKIEPYDFELREEGNAFTLQEAKEKYEYLINILYNRNK